MYKILVVEDDDLMQKVLREILAIDGYEFFLCADGRSALKSIPEEKPDLVMLDMNLPDMTGLDICRTIKADAKTKHIPVIILTGESREIATRVEGLELGADDYLFKPINAKVLLSRINSILKLSAKPTK